MKCLKITSLLLSVVMCVTMAFPSIGVIADEAAEPTEAQVEETEKKPENKKPEKKQTTKAPEKKQEPTEPKKEEPTEPEKKQEPTEPKKETPTEPEKQDPTEPKNEEPTEPEKQEPTEPKKEEPTEPEKQEPTEPKNEEPTEPEKQEPTEPKNEAPTEPEKQDPTEPKKEDPTEPEKQEPTEPEKQEPTETESQAPSETDKQAPEETEPEKEPEATEVPGGKVTKTPKNAVISNVNISDSGILTWDAVADADYYEVVIRETEYGGETDEDEMFDENYCIVQSDEPRSVDLHKLIRNFIKNEFIYKTDDNIYYIYISAVKFGEGELATSVVKTHKYETNVKPISSSKFKKVTLSKGVLSWSSIANVEYYEVWINGISFNTNKATSMNVNNAIDTAIKDRELWNEKYYQIGLYAYDVDDVELAFKTLDYKYDSKATPKELPSIPNAKIEKGKLTWSDYTGADFDHYCIRIVGENDDWTWSDDYYSPEEIDLKELIEEGIYSDEGVGEYSQYTIELYVQNKTENFIAVYIGSYKYKERNTLSVKGKTAKVKKNKVRRKKQKLKVSKVIKFKNKGQGRITYSKISGSKKISINGSNGKVTVKKKTKKGTYKVTVWVKAAGNSTYAPIKKKVTFKIKVK